MSLDHLTQLMQAQAETIAELQRQVAWLRRQVFGSKSERLKPVADAQQMSLGQVLGDLPIAPEAPKAGRRVAAHTRRVPASDFAADDSVASFFDADRVEVQVITLPCPQAQALAPDEHEIVGEKVSHRLAQRPGSYVLLKYVRPVIKRRDTQNLSVAWRQH